MIHILQAEIKKPLIICQFPFPILQISKMMNLKYQLSKGFALGVLMLGLIMLQQTGAELATAQGEFALFNLDESENLNNYSTLSGAPINNLYDNLLQREYAGPVVFPNHQVERKAQRSPSLRLRFGRSDPEMLNNIVEKRWFGDVNQKPIRSPSLRLRFGRRSDPNLPQMRRTAYDDLLERELTLNQQQMNQPSVGEETELSDDYDVAFERVVRKPQRLRWGRSLVRLIASGDDKDQVRKK